MTDKELVEYLCKWFYVILTVRCTEKTGKTAQEATIKTVI